MDSYAAYLTALEIAQKAYEDEQCRLAGLLQDSVDTGYNNVSSGTSSLDVQVCLPAGEPIPLADGTLRPVEEMLVGDLVEVPDQNDPEGPKKVCKVVAVYHNDPQPVLKLTLQNRTTGAVFERKCTENHRVYVRNQGFLPAVDMPEGAELLNASGESVILLSKELEPDPVPVYNFQVEGAHTYFVGTSRKESVLVHNDCPSCGGSGWIEWPVDPANPSKGTTSLPCRNVLHKLWNFAKGDISTKNSIKQVYKVSSSLLIFLNSSSQLKLQH